LFARSSEPQSQSPNISSAGANPQSRRFVEAAAPRRLPLQSVAVCELVTRYQKTVFTSFLVFLPAGVAAAIWFRLTRASSSVAVAGEMTIAVVALAINQAVLLVPLRRRFAAAVERQDADAL